MDEHGQCRRVHANGPSLQVYPRLPLTVSAFSLKAPWIFVQGLWLNSSWSLELGSNFLPPLYQLASYCCDNTITKRQKSGEEKFLFCLQFITHHWGKPRKGFQAGTQELKRWPWRSAAYWIAHPGLFSLPRGVTIESRQGPPTSFTKSRKWSTDLPIGHLIEAFSQSRVPDDYSLCLVEKNLTRATTVAIFCNPCCQRERKEFERRENSKSRAPVSGSSRHGNTICKLDGLKRCLFSHNFDSWRTQVQCSGRFCFCTGLCLPCRCPFSSAHSCGLSLAGSKRR